MQTMNTTQPRVTDREPIREQRRRARVERLLGDVPKLKRASRLFDERGEAEARAIAAASTTTVLTAI